MWGKRMVEEGPSEAYATFLVQDPTQVGEPLEGVIYPLEALPLKRNWQRFAGSWGKRSEEPKVISPRSNNWSSLRGWLSIKFVLSRVYG